MKIATLRLEHTQVLNECFAKKVQLDEEARENEAQIQYQRGVLATTTEISKVIDGMKYTSEIAALKARDQAKAKALAPEQTQEQTQAGVIDRKDGEGQPSKWFPGVIK